MAKTEKYTCDVCGAERLEANHWFVGALSKRISTVLPLHFTFYVWATGRNVQEAKLFHLCGQDCAHKLLDQFLSGELK
jgi:hypothetical protein